MIGPTGIIYVGQKRFGQIATTIDIIVVRHSEPNFLEVLTYDPQLRNSSPRLYIDVEVLDTKLCEQELDFLYQSALEESLNKGIIPDRVLLRNKFVDELRAQYITSKLFVSMYSISKNMYQVSLRKANIPAYPLVGTSVFTKLPLQKTTDRPLVSVVSPEGLKKFSCAAFVAGMKNINNQFIDSTEEEIKCIDFDNANNPFFTLRAGREESNESVESFPIAIELLRKKLQQCLLHPSL